MKKLILTLTILILAVAFLPVSASAQQLKTAGASDPEILPPGVTEISSSNVLLGVRGTYENSPADKLIKRINEIRNEAYQEGLASSYVPIKWSDSLEYIAQIRSVEASVKEDHVRPKGGYVWVMNVNGVRSYSENLAWGGDALGAVEMWYEEKEDLVNHTGGVTGHYESLIDPSYTYIGIGSFQRKGTWNSVCAEFTNGSGITENRTGIYGDCIQLIEVPKADVTLHLTGDDSVAVGGSGQLNASAKYSTTDYRGKTTKVSLLLPEAIWSSSNEAVASVSDGTVTGISAGTASITAELSYYGINSGLTVSKDMKVTADALPAKTEITKLVKGKKCFTVKWKKSDYATGYQIQYSLRKSMAGAKTVTVGNVTSKKIKGKTKKTYYVRVKAVNAAGESGWSAVSKVKTK